VNPQIELDQDILDYLKSEAEPFVDTPSTVLRRLLMLDDAGRDNGGERGEPSAASPSQRRPPGGKTGRRRSTTAIRARVAPGSILPERSYVMPLLRALVDAGGQAPYRDVADAVGRELKDLLRKADRETLSSGAVRWQSRLQFVRLRLIERGYLDKNSPRGVWRITDAGRAALRDGEGL
jgi:hypothetical protein